MAEETERIKATEVFDTFCAMMDLRKFSYDSDREKLEIDFSMQGEDLLMPMKFRVLPDRYVALLISPLPFRAPEDKRLEMAVAISEINYRLINGSFDLDIRDGEILFRISNSYLESKLSTELFDALLITVTQTVDRFNDTLLLLAKGSITLEQGLQKINE